MAFKTPGVYVQEITTFPPSVVAVETAVPAFIGYTEKASDADGKDLSNIPTRIKSLLEFEQIFGGPFVPAQYKVQVDTSDGAGNAIGTVTPLPTSTATETRRYYLYGCLRHFYANGGGACYIVSVGSYSDEIVLGDKDTNGLREGLKRLAGFDEPTLLVFPDGVSLVAADLGSLQQAALAQCARLQDRFMITDLHDGDETASSNDAVSTFRQLVGTNDLKYGAAYYPWIHTIYRPDVEFRRLSLVDTAETPAAIPTDTLDALTDNAEIADLVPAVRDADANVGRVVAALDISAMAGTEKLTLDRDKFADLAGHFADLLELLRQTSKTPVTKVREKFGNLLLLPRAIALALQSLGTETLPAELKQAVSDLQRDDELVGAIVGLIQFEKNTDVMKCVSTSRTDTVVDTGYAALNGKPWLGKKEDLSARNVSDITADTTVDFGDTDDPTLRATALKAAVALQAPFDRLAAAILSLFETAEFLAADAEKRLFSQHPVYRDVAERIKRTMSLLPASGAVAGVYAATDRTRGVWKAPANVSLADTVGPAVPLNDQDQADLNVHTSGKSINAIRAFAGKGTLVWGARTLAGNDNEWRYVPVRRFFNMAEESIKKATEPFVFEPNDANTWVRVRAMIENFLTVQWRQGALAGATTAEAFFVKVGLGETMTAQDILEGRMNVEVGMAVVRPAEFIILKFAHKMQVS